nr:hypothetical protein [Actinomycetales bacterium]
MEKLVLTVLGHERPGLIAALSEAVADHGGNWMESQLNVLAGSVAGIVVVEVPRLQGADFREALVELRERVGLTVTTELAPEVGEDEGEVRSVHVVGQDRPGIMSEISSALASWGVTITNLVTFSEETPMADGTVFTAALLITIPPEVDENDVQAVIEGLSGDLMVEFDELDDLADLDDEDGPEDLSSLMREMLNGLGFHDGVDNEFGGGEEDEWDGEDAGAVEGSAAAVEGRASEGEGGGDPARP